MNLKGKGRFGAVSSSSRSRGAKILGGRNQKVFLREGNSPFDEAVAFGGAVLDDNWDYEINDSILVRFRKKLENLWPKFFVACFDCFSTFFFFFFFWFVWLTFCLNFFCCLIFSLIFFGFSLAIK